MTTTTRPPEWGHTAACLAAAMIAAVENWRDHVIEEAAPPLLGRRHGALANPEDTVVPFRIWAQSNGALTEAESYLADTTMTCTCPPVGYCSTCDAQHTVLASVAWHTAAGTPIGQCHRCTS